MRSLFPELIFTKSMNTTAGSQQKTNKFRQRIWRPLPLPLRWVIWVLVVWQGILPFAPQLLADTANKIVPAPVGTSQLRMPPSEPGVTVNRNVPDVQPPSTVLQFSATPSDDEIYRSRVFSEPIVAIGNTTSTDNNELTHTIPPKS